MIPSVVGVLRCCQLIRKLGLSLPTHLDQVARAIMRSRGNFRVSLSVDRVAMAKRMLVVDRASRLAAIGLAKSRTGCWRRHRGGAELWWSVL